MAKIKGELWCSCHSRNFRVLAEARERGGGKDITLLAVVCASCGNDVHVSGTVSAPGEMLLEVKP